MNNQSKNTRDISIVNILWSIYSFIHLIKCSQYKNPSLKLPKTIFRYFYKLALTLKSSKRWNMIIEETEHNTSSILFSIERGVVEILALNYGQSSAYSEGIVCHLINYMSMKQRPYSLILGVKEADKKTIKLLNINLGQFKLSRKLSWINELRDPSDIIYPYFISVDPNN